MDGSARNQSEGPTGPGQSGPRFGVGRPTFGMTRDQGKRVEVAFALKNGGLLTVIEELDEALTADILRNYGEQLASDIARGARRTFTDGWSASGQHAWIDLGEVAAFSLRPAK